MIGLVQPGTSRGTFLQMMGSRNTTRPECCGWCRSAISTSLEPEFLHPAFIRRDGGAFDADADLLDGVGGIDRDLVVGLVAVFHAEVEIHQLDIEERKDQLVLDVLPDDPGHLVAIEFDDGFGHLDFAMAGRPFWE